ncbi:hypothetical protein GH5_03128 [Leishmania sp. Ghana 2012 LV757]|uniref:hypothetical protein n=1 Tax=Leishmania sp. Ghana 2012 LV757 TaxID=2803181 RepID=UPI001B4FB88F|nr:hypothetical protein GH5_03128 [Leishmania sp. Ghana 2012 LV757]
MAALKHANAFAEVTSLLSCGGDYVKKGTQTLSVPSVYATLDALERLWQTQRVEQHLSDGGLAQGLRHYHAVYEASARCVPLSAVRWEQWLAGLSEPGARSPMSPGTNVSSSTRSPQVQRVQTELISSYWHLYRRLCWGSGGAAKAGLAAVLEEASSAVSLLSSVVPTDAAPRLVELEAALATPLQAFARVAGESAHLFADYPLIGVVERRWLNEVVLSALGECAEPVVEVLVRRTFKRDLRVPSVALPDLLHEYEEDEVDGKKVKDLLALGQATLRSSWMRAASSLHALKAGVPDRAGPAAVSATPDASSRACSTRLTELEEDLLKVLAKVPKGQGCLPALGLLMQRLIEENREGCASAGPWHGLNGSQTQFYLHLLHQWFAMYVNSNHRWTVSNMFAAPDDADLWMFLLDRHSVCLTWALLPELPTWQNPRACTRVEARLSYLNGLAVRVDKLRAIFYSVVHCTQLYQAAAAAFTTKEKLNARLKTAAAAAHSWMKEVGVETFCRALLNDLLDAIAHWEEAQGERDPRVQQRALMVEAELKLVLYDTMTMLQCPERSTERLEKLVEVALDTFDVWGAAEREASGCTRREHEDLALPIVGIVGRCVHRISATLRRDVAAATPVTEAQASLYRKVVRWLKRGIGATASIGGDPSALWDEWISLVSIPIPSAEHPSSSALAGAGYTPALLGYAVPSTTRGGSFRRTAASGGLDDLCWERRTVAKAVRRALETGTNVDGSGGDDAAFLIDTARSGEEELGQQPLKRARVE